MTSYLLNNYNYKCFKLFRITINKLYVFSLIVHVAICYAQALITSLLHRRKILLKCVCLHSLSLIKITIRISMRQIGEGKREQGWMAGRATSATLQRLNFTKLYSLEANETNVYTDESLR